MSNAASPAYVKFHSHAGVQHHARPCPFFCIISFMRVAARSSMWARKNCPVHANDSTCKTKVLVNNIHQCLPGRSGACSLLSFCESSFLGLRCAKSTCPRPSLSKATVYAWSCKKNGADQPKSVHIQDAFKSRIWYNDTVEPLCASPEHSWMAAGTWFSHVFWSILGFMFRYIMYIRRCQQWGHWAWVSAFIFFWFMIYSGHLATRKRCKSTAIPGQQGKNTEHRPTHFQRLKTFRHIKSIGGGWPVVRVKPLKWYLYTPK